MLEYQFSEYLAGKLLGGLVKYGYAYRAVAGFSITTGRWLKYAGALSSTRTGSVFSDTEKQVEATMICSLRPE